MFEKYSGGGMSQSFSDTAIIACGTMSLELNALKQEGFLDTAHLFYTTPGLHQDIKELENQLIQRIQKVKQVVNKVIVVYGGKFCYVNSDEPLRTMQTIIDQQGEGIVRIDATHCMDMLATEDERAQIAQEMAGDEKVWWMTSGWVKFRKQVFDGWDKALANENFPKHTGGAIVLDAIGYMDQYMADHPDDFLEYCDWMGIPMQSYNVSLDRFKSLLRECQTNLI
jgi:hypothetical protein